MVKEKRKKSRKRCCSLPDRISACSAGEIQHRGGWCKMQQVQDQDVMNRAAPGMGDGPPSWTTLTKVAA